MSIDHTEYAVRVNQVTKKYKLYNNKTDRLKEAVFGWGKSYHKDFYAVNDITFDIKKGETLGIIGKNGSGKSTLLKMITGVLNPSAGSIEVNGRISALLELGAGFNPEYTGIENVYLNGTVMGLSRKEIDEKLDEIIQFADIGDFIHQPVKVYSSGMFVRLAFAVAVNVDPEILIVDEALSVGDIRFQQKCLRKIEEFKAKKTVLFVTHDVGLINNYCSRAIWINEGILMEDGSPEYVTKKYRASMADSTLTKVNGLSDDAKELYSNIDMLSNGVDVFGDKKAEIIGISMFDAKSNEKINMVDPGQKVKLCIALQSKENIANPIIGFTLTDRLGNIIFQTNSYIAGELLEPLGPNEFVYYCFEYSMPELNNGHFCISPAFASGSQEEHVQHCWVHDALIFQVTSKQKYQMEGYITLPEINLYQI